MSHYHDDNPTTRRLCQEQIRPLFAKLSDVSPIVNLEVQSLFSSAFMECLEVADRLSSSLNSTDRLPQQLSQLIGIGKQLQNRLLLLIAGDLRQFRESATSLFMIDLKSSKSLLLETRQYHHYSPSQMKSRRFEASYFRLPWFVTTNSFTKGLLREFAVVCGQYGKFFMF